MKRYIIIILCAMLVASSCSEKYVLDRVPASIGFGATTGDLSSKALVTSSAALQADGMIGVYGQFNYQGHPAKVYEGEELKYDIDGVQLWRAHNNDGWVPKYWIESCDYHFTLVSPYSSVGTVATGTNIGSGAVSYDYTTGEYTLPVTNVTKNSPDLLVGTAQRSIPAVPTASDFEPVEVALKHAFAAVEFKIRNASGKTITGIRNVKLEKVKVNGTLTVPESGVFTVDSWATSGDANSTNYITTDGTNILSSDFAYGTSESVSVFGGPVVIIPQQVEIADASSHIKFSFEYKRTGDSDYTSIGDPYDLSSADIVNAYGFTNWEPGKKYTYIATITTDTIIFQVEVRDWRDGGTYVL